MADRTVAIEDILDAEHAPCRETIAALEAENARLRNRLELIKNRGCECEYDEEGERDILCPSCLAAGALSDGKLQEVLAEALSAVKEE